MKSQEAKEVGIEYKPYTYTVLMPPVTKKMLDKISEMDELPKNNKIISALKGGLLAFRKEKSKDSVETPSPTKKHEPDDKIKLMQMLHKKKSNKDMGTPHLNYNSIAEEDESMSSNSTNRNKMKKVKNRRATFVCSL